MSSTKYAVGTDSPVQNSRAELERVISAHGADEIIFRSGRDGRAGVLFRIDGVMVRVTVHVPPVEDFTYDSAGRKRPEGGAHRAREAEERRLWRVLLLLVKAKFEAIALGIHTFQEEFMADVLLPDNSTVSEWLAPQLTSMRERGVLPQPYANLLPPPRDA